MAPATQHNVWLSIMSGAASSLMLFILMTAYQAQADNSVGDPQTPGAIPPGFAYEGHLDWDGVPYSGQAQMRFMLFNQPEGGDCIWENTQVTQVYTGRFSTHLSVPDTVIRGGGLYIGLQVKRCLDATCEGELIDLQSRQQINPAPYARWAAGATNLEVWGTANFGGQANFNNSATFFRPASFSNGLTVNEGAVELPNAAIQAHELDPAIAGTGLEFSNQQLKINPDFLRNEIRNWVHTNCFVAIAIAGVSVSSRAADSFSITGGFDEDVDSDDAISLNFFCSN